MNNWKSTSVIKNINVLKRCFSSSNTSKMRLVQFAEGGHSRVGVEVKKDGDIIDLHAMHPAIATNMKTFLEGGASNLSVAQKYV